MHDSDQDQTDADWSRDVIGTTPVVESRVNDAISSLSAHVVFSGGGTAGHLFPGLAVAEYLRAASPQMRITFVGSGKALERRHVSAAGFDHLALACQPLPRSAKQVWPFITAHFAGVRVARRFIRDEQVSAVVGLGGFASIPMARAAIRRRVPLMLLEQNAYPGRATRLLDRYAKVICLAQAKAKPNLRTAARIYVTGNPLRTEFEQLAAAERPDRLATDRDGAALRRLLVLGGSGGSRQLNEIVPKALYKVRSHLAGWQIVHQTGEAKHAETETLYRKFDLPATVVPFVLNVPQVLRWTDLAICRAGGTTLAELAAASVPAVLIPWTEATNDHQRRNAEVYTQAGGAITLDATAATGRLDDSLAEMLILPLEHAEIRDAMAAAMRKLARPNATRHVAMRLGELLAAICQTAAA